MNHNYPNIWNPPIDYIIGEYKGNYISRLRLKIRKTIEEIDYLYTVINNPRVPNQAKIIYFVPQILRCKEALKKYEKQGSLLAA